MDKKEISQPKEDKLNEDRRKQERLAANSLSLIFKKLGALPFPMNSQQKHG
jgi:hypothetical protein